MSKLTVFDYRRGARKAYNEAIKYWSDADGRLRYQGKRNVAEDDLPKQLKQAYRRFIRNKYESDLHYLVETKKGYGIAVAFEYDKCTAANSGLRCDDFAFTYLFCCLLLDAEKIANNPLFQDAQVFATEYLGYDDCHELIVVFPASISKKEFDAALLELQDIAYDACFDEHDPPKKMAAASRILKDVREGKYFSVDETIGKAKVRSKEISAPGNARDDKGLSI